jgi:phospholipase/carboxylesterase
MLRLAGLDVHAVGDGDGPLVILLHGFGASGSDLVALAHVIDAPQNTRFLFPAAPLELDSPFGESRAWWLIDWARRERAVAAGRADALTRDVPPGLPEARTRVIALVREAAARFPAASGIVLGGFSQGAMLSLDVALHDAQPLTGLALLSPTMIAEDEWRPRMASRRGLRVLLSHGRQDPLLPFAVSERLRDALTEAGLDVRWVPFDGQHEIPPTVVDALGSLIRGR